MARRFLHLFLAMFWFVWIGLILPVHTVGFVPLGNPGNVSGNGSGAWVTMAAPRCPLCVARAPAPGKTTPAAPASGCALCDLKVKLYAGAVIIADLEPGELLAIAAVPRLAALSVQGLALPSDSRAPPSLPMA